MAKKHREFKKIRLIRCDRTEPLMDDLTRSPVILLIPVAASSLCCMCWAEVRRRTNEGCISKSYPFSDSKQISVIRHVLLGVASSREGDEKFP